MAVRSLRSSLTPLYGKGETEAMIRIIFHYLKGWNTVDLLINEDRPLSPYIQEKINDIEKRLLAYEPIQYITGQAYFYGMDFHVAPGVLVPRPETEGLVDLIVKENKEPDLRVLDVGTGSGCIAIALARNLPFPDITALDISEKALTIAKENAVNLKARNIHFIHADIFKWNPDPESFDIIVSNPPYIDESERVDMEANVLGYEPETALFVSDDDPLSYYRRIGEISLSALSSSGKLYFEINPRHSNDLKAMLKDMGFKDIELHTDIHGRDRILSCRR